MHQTGFEPASPGIQDRASFRRLRSARYAPQCVGRQRALEGAVLAQRRFTGLTRQSFSVELLVQTSTLLGHVLNPARSCQVVTVAKKCVAKEPQLLSVNCIRLDETSENAFQSVASRGGSMPEARASIDHILIHKLVASWPKRATVRSGKFPWSDLTPYNSECPDYPMRIVPFRDHALFQAASPEQRRQVLTWAWLVYNERTILAEEHMANPAFTMIMHGVFGGADEIHVRQAVQHALIDEHFHTLIHTIAIDETRRLRAISALSRAPDSVTRRRMLELLAQVVGPMERALVTLAFAIVAEVSVNAYLSLLAEDETIQPMHKLVTYLHNRDEFAHSQIVVEVAKLLYLGMNERDQQFFLKILPEALKAYASHDFSAWRAILDNVGVAGADRIVADCEHDVSSQLLVRDFSGLRRIAEELEIVGRLDFGFAT